MNVARPSGRGGQERNCPLCGNGPREARWTKGTLRVVACAGCGMLFASPVEEELASGAFYDRLAVPFYLSPDKLAGDYAAVLK